MRERYPLLSVPVTNNYYAIANKSLLDFGTVLQIMDASGLKYELVDADPNKLRSVQGVLRCDEYSFLPIEAQAYFLEQLASNCIFNFNVVSVVEESEGVEVVGIINGLEMSERFDRVIDCTYNHLQLDKEHMHYFEPCIMLKYR